MHPHENYERYFQNTWKNLTIRCKLGDIMELKLRFWGYDDVPMLI